MYSNCVLTCQDGIRRLCDRFRPRCVTRDGRTALPDHERAAFNHQRSCHLIALRGTIRNTYAKPQREALNRRQRAAQCHGVTLYRVTLVAGLELHTRLWS